MQPKFPVLLVAILLTQTLFSQNQLPVIKANSKKVDIKDGDQLFKDAWQIVPQEKPDVYKTAAKHVTFYTDIDSIAFNVDPEVGVYDFVILLNGKDSARTQIRYQLPRIEILKKAALYNNTDNRFVPRFSYQHADDPDLKRIRQALQLDSIAGKGNELSKIFNLLHWVHNCVKHDGNSENPTSKNAVDLISVCRTENRGVNCRMMATILNECYLAMDITSRYITCMPRETNFDDCHVINTAMLLIWSIAPNYINGSG